MLHFLMFTLLGCGDKPGEDTGQPHYDAVQVGAVTWEPNAEIQSVVTVRWEQMQSCAAWVEFREVDEESWHASPTMNLEAGPQQALVLGIPFDTPFTFRVVNDFGDGALPTDEVEASTGPLPEGFFGPTVLVSEDSAFGEEDRWLLGSNNADPGGWTEGNYWTWILDRQARVVWARLSPNQHWTLYASVSRDGNDLLVDDFTYWSGMDAGKDSRVLRLKIDGTEVASYATPGGHHAFVELPDESIVWGSAGWYTETLEQVRPDGSQETVWDCQPFHDAMGIKDACQSNSLFWNEETDSFLYSFYTTSGLLEIDHASGGVLKIWGSYDGAWPFEPVESAFMWQHGVSITGDGTLLLSTMVWESKETAVREYRIDDDNEVLAEVWSFGEGEGIFANSNGDAARLANGNTLHNYGSAGRLREITADGQVVWDLDWQGAHLLGRTSYIADLYALAP